MPPLTRLVNVGVEPTYHAFLKWYSRWIDLRKVHWLTHRAGPHDALPSCVTPTTLPGVDCTFFDWPFGSHEPNVSSHGIGYMATVAVGLLKPPAMQWASLIILFGYRLEVSQWNMQPYPRQYENLPEYLTLLNSAHTLVGQKELWKIEKDQSLMANRWQYLFKWPTGVWHPASPSKGENHEAKNSSVRLCDNHNTPRFPVRWPLFLNFLKNF